MHVPTQTMTASGRCTRDMKNSLKQLEPTRVYMVSLAVDEFSVIPLFFFNIPVKEFHSQDEVSHIH